MRVPASTFDRRGASYVRRVSPTERGMLIIHQVQGFQVDGIVEGRGEIDAAALRAAVARAADANPGVRVRLKGALGFSSWVDSGIPPEVRVMPLSDWDGNSERATDFMSQPFDPLHGGPVAEVLIVPCKDGMTRLVFRSLHAAVDGRGLIHWTREVFRALRGEPLQGSDSRLMDIEVQERHRTKVTPAPKTPALKCIPVVEPGPGAPLPYIWRRVVIARPVSDMLMQTLSFLAKWTRERVPDSDVAFTVPVDLRGLRTDEVGVGNLTAYLNLAVGPDDTPRSLAQALIRRIRGYADCKIVPVMRILWWLPIRFLAYRLRRRIPTLLFTANKYLPSGGVASMGNLKEEWFSCPGFQGRALYGIPASVGKLNVIFINYPTETLVIFSTPAAYNHLGQLDAMIAAYCRHFQQRSDTPAGGSSPRGAA
jgi:hypothetical protein